MFGNKQQAANAEEIETIIGKQTQVKGNITAGSSIRIDGTLDGDLTASGDVIIGANGVVTGAIKARTVTVAGTVNGNLDVADRLELLPTAKINGDIAASVLVVGEGAVFKGNCAMCGDQVTKKETKVGLVKK